jgi:mono/diheme cytochrome c family protein
MLRESLAVSVVAILLFARAANGQLTVAQAELIDEGFRVFTEETFDGNGRTCATCHVPSEGYNIYPATIEELNKRERALVFASNVPGLENIDLIETHALFNISGGPAPLCPASNPECFDDADGHSGPIFRASMALQALDLTTKVDETVVAGGDFHGTPLLPPGCSTGVELELPQLGWSGDGSPGTPTLNFVDLDMDGFNDCHEHHGHLDVTADGSVRAFASGAIAQHLPRSLDRIPGVDFRRATAAELDALEAFQRWLGRRPLTAEENAAQGTENASEFSILQLDFKDPRVAQGRDHFASNDGARCNRCHVDGGALGGGGGGNNNAITNVGLAGDDIGVAVVGFALPTDEGTIVTAFAGGDTGTLFGAFNTQSIIEAAKKKAWFHNHKVVGDLEEAIAHYGSNDFLVGGPKGRPIGTVKPLGGLVGLQFGGQAAGAVAFPAGDGIEHLGAFLRALSAFYGLRDCERLLDEAVDRIALGVSAENPVRHCQFNLSHVMRVLDESKLPGLHTDVQHDAKQAYSALNPSGRNRNIKQLARIKASIRAMRDSIATQVAP